MATYYDLSVSCPICLNKGKVTPPSQWYHSDCGGKIQIGDDAHIRCVSCSKNEHIRYWKFGCADHNYKYEYATAAAFAAAISMAGQLTNTLAGVEWLHRLTGNMGKF